MALRRASCIRCLFAPRGAAVASLMIFGSSGRANSDYPGADTASSHESLAPIDPMKSGALLERCRGSVTANMKDTLSRARIIVLPSGAGSPSVGRKPLSARAIAVWVIIAYPCCSRLDKATVGSLILYDLSSRTGFTTF